MSKFCNESFLFSLSWFTFKNDKSGCLLHELRLLDSDLLDLDVVCGPDQELHFHGLDGNEWVIRLHLLADLAVDLDDCAWHGTLHKVLLVHHETWPR